MNPDPHLHISVRVNVEEDNLERVKNVARVLGRIESDDPPSKSEARDALADLFEISEIRGAKLSEYLDPFEPKINE